MYYENIKSFISDWAAELCILGFILLFILICFVAHQEAIKDSIRDLAMIAKKKEKNEELEKIFGTSDEDLIEYKIRRKDHGLSELRDRLELAILGESIV